jgi:hypothetical protein
MQVTKFNLVTDLQIMLSNVTDSHFYPECNTERGFIHQLYIELGFMPKIYYFIYDSIPLHPSVSKLLSLQGYPTYLPVLTYLVPSMYGTKRF